MKTVCLFLLVVLTAASCSNGNADDKDTVLPVVTIASPASGQVFTAGQNIVIGGTISDDKFIAETHIHVINNNTGALLMDVHLYPNGNAASFNQSITAATGINYKIRVIAKDRAANEGLATVDVSCN